MKKKRILLVSIFAFALLFNCSTTVRAETFIPDETIIQDEIWTKDKGPYVLEGGVFINPGGSLTIEAGTKIQAKQGLENIPTINVDRGRIRMYGTENDKVTLENIYGLFLSSSSTAILSNVVANFKYGISTNWSTMTITNSQFYHSERAIESKASDVLILDSTITDNQYGIYVLSSARPYLMKNQVPSYTGGEGNAFADMLPMPGTGVKVENTSILRSSEYGIKNAGDNTVLAINNWWGNTEGPNTDTLNRISGDVLFEPWLRQDPNQKIICCSSVLFIPGLEASQLFKNELSSAFGTSTNTLWEPNNNNDVYKLYMDKNGSSTDKSIYSGKPIGKAYGYFGIYDRFMNYLDSLVNDRTIHEWKAFGYDWRKSIPDLVSGIEYKATTTDSLIQSVESLANQSNTKKVTVIAHSNGGLITKLLLSKLDQMGKANLIDKVISVAVPYLGTPQAIAGLLYGDKQSIAYGLILSKSVARGLGENMPSAYSLLPSSKYFEQILTPTIVFANTDTKNLNNNNYPKEINDAKSQNDFIIDKYSDRKDTRFTDITKPIKGNSYLLDMADSIHKFIDYMDWPSTISKLSIAGYNKLTTAGLQYDENGKVKMQKTINGDGTVVYPSATYDDGEVVALDLDTITKTNNKNINHANILESAESLKIIDEAIKSKNISKSILSSGVSTSSPNNFEPTNLVISTHSPVELHVYDQYGNHTGLIDKPKNLGIEDDVFQMFEANIPGSDYSGGEEDDDKYVYIPESRNNKYTVEVVGRGLGEFSLDIERISGAKTLNRVSYENVPVTPFMSASTSVTTIGDGTNTSVEKNKFSSSTSLLSVDLFGAGNIDLKVKQNEKISSGDVLNHIQKFIDKNIKDKNRNKRINKIIEKIRKKIGEDSKNHKNIRNISWRIEHFNRNSQKNMNENKIEEYMNEMLKDYDE